MQIQYDLRRTSPTTPLGLLRSNGKEGGSKRRRLKHRVQNASVQKETHRPAAERDNQRHPKHFEIIKQGEGARALNSPVRVVGDERPRSRCWSKRSGIPNCCCISSPTAIQQEYNCATRILGLLLSLRNRRGRWRVCKKVSCPHLYKSSKPGTGLLRERLLVVEYGRGRGC